MHNFDSQTYLLCTLVRSIALISCLHIDTIDTIDTRVAEDPSGATVCTTQWNKIQSCYTLEL